MTTKICPRCKEDKPLTEYGSDRSRKNGLNIYCYLCHKARVKEYDPEQRRRYNYVRYGLTLAEYEEILDNQNGMCAVCGAKPGSKRAHHRQLAVDHDHTCCPGNQSCGKCVRGLLCGSCNHALGNVSDDYDTLLRLAAYILRSQSVLDIEFLSMSPHLKTLPDGCVHGEKGN